MVDSAESYKHRRGGILGLAVTAVALIGGCGSAQTRATPLDVTAPPKRPPASPNASAASLEPLKFMVGHWRVQDGATTTDEVWFAAAEDAMLGVNWTSVDGRLVHFECLRIEANLDGRIRYVAKPATQAEATFVASSVKVHVAAFTNSKHDFPQRIQYRLIDADHLEAIASAPGKGAQSWRYVRVVGDELKNVR